MASESRIVVGLDVSAASVDAGWSIDDKPFISKKFENNIKGFKAMLQVFPKEAHCVMEATGPYSCSLATYLHSAGLAVSVVNPLVIKRFTQMRMERTKTDKADAILISQYGTVEKPELWEPLPEHSQEIQQLFATQRRVIKARVAAQNQLHAFQASGALLQGLKDEIMEEIEALNKRCKELDQRMQSLIKEHEGDLKQRLETIPGIGPKISLQIIVSTNGLKSFETHNQLISYFGLAPRHFESGTSVKGKSRICKMGMKQVRALLYMGARSAKRYNPACKALYERLMARGKKHRVAMIAVINKMLKQAFAIAKSGEVFEKDHHPNFQAFKAKTKDNLVVN